MDMTESQSGSTIGLVRVTNVGRRPAHIGAVALQLPDAINTTTYY